MKGKRGKARTMEVMKRSRRAEWSRGEGEVWHSFSIAHMAKSETPPCRHSAVLYRGRIGFRSSM